MKKSLLAVAAVCALVVGVGCGNGSSGGGGSTTSTVDMVVTEFSASNDTMSAYIWFDVLSNSGPNLPDPDVTLDLGVHSPVNAYFYNGDLYIATTSTSYTSLSETGGILIYRDYLNLTDSSTADALLYDDDDPAVGPESIQWIALENDVMAATTWYDGALNAQAGLYLWDNAGSITDGQAPDVFLDDTTLTLTPNFLNTCVQDVVLHDGMLLVATCNTGTDVAVGIWNDVQDILSGGATTNPDTVLTDQDNFLNYGYGMRDLLVDDNGALYVTEYYGHYLYKFNDVTAIDASSLPDVILSGCNNGSNTNNCDMDTTNAAVVVNDMLFVANHNENYDNSYNPGVTGWLAASNLAANQEPSVRLTHEVGMGQADRLATAGGALFISGVELDSYDSISRSVHIYRDPASTLFSVAADLSIQGDQDINVNFLEYPTGIGVTVRGTFDNFADTGT